MNPELIAIGVLVAGAIGAQFRMMHKHVEDCRKADAERARILGMCETIMSELNAMRTWRDESLPKRLDTIVSDLYGTLSNHRTELDRWIAAREHK